MKKKTKKSFDYTILRKKALFIILFVVVFMVYWLTPFLGNAWFLEDLKPLPPRLLIQRLSRNEYNNINNTFNELESRWNKDSYLTSTSDACVDGQNNWKVNDGYSNKCTVTVTRFYVDTGEFRNEAIELGILLGTLGWDNTDNEGNTYSSSDIKGTIKTYDMYINTSRETSSEFEQRTGFKRISYSLNELHNATYFTKTKDRVDIQFGETSDRQDYISKSYLAVQHPISTIGYDKFSISDDDIIINKARNLGGKYIIAIGITGSYYSN